MDTNSTLLKEKRKGMLHTLEAIFEFLMVIGFVTFVMPYLNNGGQVSKQTQIYVYQALSNMEKSGTLGNLAAAQNLSGIKSELNKTLQLPIKFTIGMSRSNISYGKAYPKENSEFKYVNFTANKTSLDYASLQITYTNATNPAIYMNGQYLASHSGDYSGNEEIFDLSAYVQTGANSVMLNTSNNATIDYRLTVVDSVELEAPAENRSITTVGYIISGNGSSFSPSEIRVYVWR